MGTMCEQDKNEENISNSQSQVGSMDMDSGFCSRSGTPNIHISAKNLASRCGDEDVKEEASMESNSPVSSILTDDIPLLKSSYLGDSSSEASSTSTTTTTATSTTKRDYHRNYDGYKTNQENNYFRRYHNHYNNNYNGHQPRYHNNHNHHNNGHYNRHYNRRQFQGQHNEFYHHSNNYNNFHQNQHHHQMAHGGMPNSMSNSTPSSGQQLNPLNNPEMDENLHPSILAARKAVPWPNSSGDHLPVGLQGPATNNKPYYTQQSSNSGDTANSINFGSDSSTNANPSCGDISGTATTTANSTPNGTTGSLEQQNSSSNNVTHHDKYPQKYNHDNQFYFKKIPNFAYGNMPRFQNNYRNYGGNRYGKHYHNDYYHNQQQHYHHHPNPHNIIHGPPPTPTASSVNGQALVSSTTNDLDDNICPNLMSSKREENNSWNAMDTADTSHATVFTLPMNKGYFSQRSVNDTPTLNNGSNSISQHNNATNTMTARTNDDGTSVTSNSCRENELYDYSNGTGARNGTVGISINATNPIHTYQSYPGFFSVNNGVVGLRNGNGALYNEGQRLHVCEGICEKVESSSSEWSEDNTEQTNFSCSTRSTSPGELSLGSQGTVVNSKKRYNSGPNANNSKHSPLFGRNKKPYNIHQVPFDASDIDPEDRVKSFKFGEVTEKPSALLQNNEWDPLSEAIWEKFATNQQTTDTFRKKMELWREVMSVVSTMPVKEPRDARDFLRYGLQVVGSTMSGFGSNTSDVDICMLMRKFEVDQRFEAVDRLSETLQSFRTASLVGRAEIIYAKVPILKFRDANKGLEVDLNCNNFVGIRNTQLLYCYSQLDWRVKPLVLVVKLWAQLQGINDAKNMTVSSYSLVLMVIHFLQCGCVKPVLPCLQSMYPEKFSPNNDIMRIRINDSVPKYESQNTESIAELLVGFLEYYSHKFDYTRNAVSIRVGSTIPIKSCMHSRSLKNDPHQWKYLCVEEPFDLTNTARSVYDKDAFDKIRGVFYTSWQRILISRDLESIFVLIPENEARAVAARIR